jgi:alanyl-tRNA synthetase
VIKFQPVSGNHFASTMHTLKSDDVVKSFIEYYQSQEYRAIPGSSLLDSSVPMAFVMSAGLSQVETSAKLDVGGADKYVLIQNCFRHFDLSNVGLSTTHLSLFQMPGAFTFGTLNKHDIIVQTWQLLTKVYGFQTDSLWVSCFAGGAVAGYPFEPDWETYRAWRQVGMPEDRIVRLGPNHNFWKQGAGAVGKKHTPKCGPNTEVFFDRGAHLACGSGCLPGCGCGRFVEFLNTLFITLHIDEQADFVEPLKEPFTETVVGAERVVMLLQEAASVFEIDSLRPLVESVHSLVKVDGLAMANQIRHERVIVDHMRALLFLTADGAPPPGRGGRARLMRTLVRRLLTCQKLLRIADPTLIPSLVRMTSDLHAGQQPQLLFARGRVLEYLTDEASRFEQTIECGSRHLDRILNQHNRTEISAQEVLDLVKHRGVPLPLLEEMLAQRGVGFDRQAYQEVYIQWRQSVAGTH